jgi:hypothetical protein
MLGRDDNDPLFLQVKQAEASVLSRFVGASKYANMGQRVVAGQRLMQASSDIFLGWQRAQADLDGKQHDFYVRQLRDWKYSIAIEVLVPGGMRIYGELCGWTLARAHGRSGAPSRPTSAVPTSSTGPLPGSRASAPIRTNGTPNPSSTPSPQDG